VPGPLGDLACAHVLFLSTLSQARAAPRQSMWCGDDPARAAVSDPCRARPGTALL